MRALFHDLSVAEADSYGLVLTSSGIRHQIKKGQQGWTLWVREMDSAEALRAIGQYLDENEEYISSNHIPPTPFRKNWSGVWVSLGLVGLHILFRTGSGVEDLFGTYGSSAFLILNGDYYRVITSLMLHGSTVHLLGNVVGVALFGTAVCSLTGVGLGWLMILTTGVSGNLLNALFYGTGHFSVGSSTAVFGAMGILTAHQSFGVITRKRRRRIKAWVPFAGGLALLGLLGTGERADLMAHLFGFSAGIALGFFGASLPKRLTTSRYQCVSLVITFAVVALAWLRPFMSG